jgi:hypothetical protein
LMSCRNALWIARTASIGPAMTIPPLSPVVARTQVT